MQLPRWLNNTESAGNAGQACLILGLEGPLEGHHNPLQYSSGESHGQRSLVGYSLWGHKEWDTTEARMLTHE